MVQHRRHRIVFLRAIREGVVDQVVGRQVRQRRIENVDQRQPLTAPVERLVIAIVGQVAVDLEVAAQRARAARIVG